MEKIPKQRPTGEKTNPEYKLVAATKDGQIEIGHLHLASQSGGLESDVTSGIYLQAYHSLHYMTMDIDGPRAGWTLNRSPGPNYTICASETAGSTKDDKGFGYLVLAENGDVVIRAPKGRVRISGLDVDIRAEGPDNTRGSININANQTINIQSKGSVLIDGPLGMKISTTGSMQIIANTSMALVSNFINGLTAASANKGNKSAPSSQSSDSFNQHFS